MNCVQWLWAHNKYNLNFLFLSFFKLKERKKLLGGINPATANQNDLRITTKPRMYNTLLKVFSIYVATWYSKTWL